MYGQAIADGPYHSTGFYLYGGERNAMAMDVSIQGVALTGQGIDSVGKFTIHGAIARDGTTTGFEKRYATHSIEYNGTLVDGTKLVGQWRYPQDRHDSGEFVLVLEPANVAPVVEKALWKGHYTQFHRQHATAQELVIYSTGRIEGSGRDKAGTFTIVGRFVGEIATQGPFLYTKQYRWHAISYEGVREGAVLTGIYQSMATGRGAFMLQDHSSRL